MDLKGTINKKAVNNAEQLRQILEAELKRIIWEMNFCLLLEQELQGNILFVETAEVTEVSVPEQKKPQMKGIESVRIKIKNLLCRVFGRSKKEKRNRKEGKKLWQQ